MINVETPISDELMRNLTHAVGTLINALGDDDGGTPVAIAQCNNAVLVIMEAYDITPEDDRNMQLLAARGALADLMMGLRSAVDRPGDTSLPVAARRAQITLAGLAVVT